MMFYTKLKSLLSLKKWTYVRTTLKTTHCLSVFRYFTRLIERQEPNLAFTQINADIT